MTQTYTSNEISVQRGGVTTHDTDSVDPDISIVDARVRWKGVNGSKTDYSGDAKFTAPGVKPSDTEVTYSLEYPDVTSGYDFLDHSYDLEMGADATTNDSPIEITYSASTGFGDSISNKTITVDDGEDIVVLEKTYYTKDEDEVGSFTIHDVTDTDPDSSTPKANPEFQVQTRGTKQVPTYTTDPAVTRDVSGSYTGELNDGEWSPWVSMSGMEAGVNEFYHDISGSEEAVFQFEYDWEYIYPTPAKQLRVSSLDGSKIHKISVTDTDSDRLDYNHVRTVINGNVYAIDVVDPSDPKAIDWIRIGTPNYGVVSPRAYETIDNS